MNQLIRVATGSSLNDLLNNLFSNTGQILLACVTEKDYSGFCFLVHQGPSSPCVIESLPTEDTRELRDLSTCFCGYFIIKQGFAFMPVWGNPGSHVNKRSHSDRSTTQPTLNWSSADLQCDYSYCCLCLVYVTFV
jgi:hypothetical protein